MLLKLASSHLPLPLSSLLWACCYLTSNLKNTKTDDKVGIIMLDVTNCSLKQSILCKLLEDLYKMFNINNLSAGQKGSICLVMLQTDNKSPTSTVIIIFMLSPHGTWVRIITSCRYHILSKNPQGENNSSYTITADNQHENVSPPGSVDQKSAPPLSQQLQQTTCVIDLTLCLEKQPLDPQKKTA